MIPISRDVAALVGDWAEFVENRSLLHEKFALPKVWGAGTAAKLNDSGRWSVLRIVTRGAELLRRDGDRLAKEAGGHNVRPDVAARKQTEAAVARKMALVARADGVLAKVGNRNAAQFLEQLKRSFAGRVAAFEATLGSRMMVNLAGGVVENAGIALDRCFGLPLIPGSAVKGITRVQALWEIHESEGQDRTRLLRLALLLFGYGAHDLKGDFAWAAGKPACDRVVGAIDATEYKGCACFLPAYALAPPTLVVDMVNPHYRDYYRGARPHAEDNESPVPNYFPAVEAGSAFGFAVLLNRVPGVLGANAAELLDQAKLWLERAVTCKGAGAKTAAGYGWFELGRPALPTAPQASLVRPSVAVSSPGGEIVARFRSLASKENFVAALPLMADLADDADLRKVFETLVPPQERNRLRKNNPYWQAFTSGRAGTSGQRILARLGIKLT